MATSGASSTTDYAELLPLEGSSSTVWNYFGFPSKDGKITVEKKKRTHVFCKICTKKLKYTGGTTNLRFHLQENRKSVFLSLPSTERSSKTMSLPVNQPTLAQTVTASQPFPTSSSKWCKLTDSVMYFILKDMQPLDTIDDQGFRRMLHEFEPRYVPPSRKTITTKNLPSIYNAECSRIKSLTQSAKFFSLTTDLWTSRANHAYTGLTAHFFDTSFDLHHYLLATKEFPEAHTAINIADELLGILQEWEIKQDAVAAITTDNGANITLAVRNLRWFHVPCFSHTLQLGVEKVLKIPAVIKATARCKRIVTHFHHSSKSSYLLNEKQANLGHKQHSLVQDVATRWNSTYYMMERIIEQQQPLCATLLELHKADLMPSDTEFSTLETFVSVMKPLVDITEAIGGEKWITISTVRPLLHKLLQSHLLPSSDDNSLTRTIKKTILTDLQNRYVDETLQNLNKATLLDPQFKSLKFLSQEERKDVVSDLEDDIDLIDDVNSTDDYESTAPTKPKKGKLMSIFWKTLQKELLNAYHQTKSDWL